MLIPKRVKYRRQHRPTRSGVSKGGNRINFGDYAIQALEPAYITNRQIEAARANVKPGRILFEMTYPNDEVAIEALRRAGQKLPCKVRIIKKEDQF